MSPLRLTAVNGNFYVRTRTSGAGVAQSVYCLTTDWTTGRSRFDPRQRQAKDISSNFSVKIGSGAHPASCPMGTGGPLPGDKARPGCDADHSPPFSAEVVNE
jgi:hypothetical protein